MRPPLKFILGICFLTTLISARADILVLSVPHGLSMFSNPYDHGDNSVGSLFPTVPEGLQLYTFDAPTQRWRVNQFQFGAWGDPSQSLQPHQGGFFRNPTNAFSIT